MSVARFKKSWEAPQTSVKGDSKYDDTAKSLTGNEDERSEENGVPSISIVHESVFTERMNACNIDW